jgi:hypothetical protein
MIPLNKSAGGFFMHRTKGNQVVYNLRARRYEMGHFKRNWQLTNAGRKESGS